MGKGVLFIDMSAGVTGYSPRQLYLRNDDNLNDHPALWYSGLVYVVI
jgi:hypothetical protein